MRFSEKKEKQLNVCFKLLSDLSAGFEQEQYEGSETNDMSDLLLLYSDVLPITLLHFIEAREYLDFSPKLKEHQMDSTVLHTSFDLYGNSLF